MDYATDHRTTIEMRCSVVGRWSNVFLHAPKLVPVHGGETHLPILGTEGKREGDDWVLILII
jgi:hypothetical protein